MKTVNYDEKIEVLGVVFNGVRDIISHALDGKPKDGVYVGEDSERYPCFDSDDYASENRYYWNFVFAGSAAELEAKLKRLKAMSQLKYDYNKLSKDLHPMAYWGGDRYYPLCLTEECD